MLAHAPQKDNSQPPLACPQFDCIALLLQGGGALGAYQGGVAQALDEAQLRPDWYAGISIGAINAAILASNPRDGVAKLRAFWEFITASPAWNDVSLFEQMLQHGNEVARGVWSQANAAMALTRGVPGFFTPRPPCFYPDGTLAATSLYDTSELRPTLKRFIDFEYLNSGKTRLSVGAVNVRNGNFIYFDTTTHKIGPEHLMASGALPPALPAIEIEGEYYWDGGLVSNTPLQWVMEATPVDTLAFNVDLWSSTGEFPKNMLDVMTRDKDIRYSSRTRTEVDRFKAAQKLRHAFAALYEKLPDDLKAMDETKLLQAAADTNVYSIVHLIYRAKNYEGHFKDFEFSRLSMEEHWRVGYNDTLKTLRNPQVMERPQSLDGIATFDLTKE